MSDIKVGDLVMIVKPSACGSSTSIGQIFKVSAIKENMTANHNGVKCQKCSDAIGTKAKDPVDGRWCMTFRLIRIDPLREPETIETNEEIPA